MFAQTNNAGDNENNHEKVEDEWLIRPCDTYTCEYKDCRSFAARFHQYFVFGKHVDCTQWKRDADNCYKWKDDKDIKAAKELIESEKSRRMQRLKAHYLNDTWKKRNSPPEDWAKPLPEYIQKEYEATYLNIKSKEMKGETLPGNLEQSYCTIM